ncbi:MAG: hypothetical protein H6672_11680 [Anaerolineaceae bacterium]|nr:hypothetical protein [Anaerolineaceae bacterium]
MAAAEQSQPPASTARHRRETWLGIYLPAGLFALLMAGGVLLVVVVFAAPEKRWGLSLIADLLLTVLILCPSMLCLGVIAVGLAVASIKIGVLHNALARPLRRAQQASAKVSQRAENATGTLSEYATAFSARMVFLSKLMNVFDQPEDEAENDHHD